MLAEMRVLKIDRVVAKCQEEDCGWKASGQILVEEGDDEVVGGGILDDCQKHHLEYCPKHGDNPTHFRFNLLLKEQLSGFVAVTSKVRAGYFNS